MADIEERRGWNRWAKRQGYRLGMSHAEWAWREGLIIRKVKGGYEVKSEKGKNLGGPYRSKAQAAKRLREVEFFKHKGGK